MGPKSLEISVLGPLAVSCAGQPVRLGGPLPRSVLAMMAITPGQVVSTDRFLDELWGGKSPTAWSSLKSYLSRLRRLLPEGSIVRSYDGYLLDIDPKQLDRHLFEQYLDDARTAASAARPEAALRYAHDALALWRGVPLDGLDQAAPLVVAEASRLAELRIQAETIRVGALLALDRPTEAVAELAALTRQHPLQEKLWELYILALYRCGRPTEALRTYERLRALLAEETGMKPNPALRALQEAIYRDDPDLLRPGRESRSRGGVNELALHLSALTETATEGHRIEQELQDRARRARSAGATWTEIGTAAGLAAIEAERRWRLTVLPPKRPKRPGGNEAAREGGAESAS